jgi:hypothetical protein
MYVIRNDKIARCACIRREQGDEPSVDFSAKAFEAASNRAAPGVIQIAADAVHR